jgi:hypothetical protein
MNETLTALSALVCKSHVGVGGLTNAQRTLALAVPALALPAGTTFDEAEVNALLKAALAGAAGFLDTDHVELRRWLVDSGWWRRDGYGRRYTRAPTDALPPALQAVARSLDGLDLAAWAGAQRAARRRERDARRAAWASRSGAS